MAKVSLSERNGSMINDWKERKIERNRIESTFHFISDWLCLALCLSVRVRISVCGVIDFVPLQSNRIESRLIAFRMGVVLSHGRRPSAIAMAMLAIASMMVLLPTIVRSHSLRRESKHRLLNDNGGPAGV